MSSCFLILLLIFHYIADTREPTDNSGNDYNINLEENLRKLNSVLSLLNQTPIKKNNVLRLKKFPEDLFSRAQCALKDLFDSVVKPQSNTFDESDLHEDPGNEIIHQLKEKFELSNDPNEKMRILSVLPQSWSIRKIQSMPYCLTSDKMSFIYS